MGIRSDARPRCSRSVCPCLLSVGCGNKGCGLGVPDLRGSLVKKARIKKEPKAARAPANF